MKLNILSQHGVDKPFVFCAARSKPLKNISIYLDCFRREQRLRLMNIRRSWVSVNLVFVRIRHGVHSKNFSIV